MAQIGEPVEDVIESMCNTIKRSPSMKEIYCDFNGERIVVNLKNCNDPQSVYDNYMNQLYQEQVNHYATPHGLNSLNETAAKIHKNQISANKHFSDAMNATNQKDLAIELSKMSEFTDYSGVDDHSSVIIKKMNILGCAEIYPFGKIPETEQENIDWFFASVRDMFDRNLPIHPVLGMKMLEILK